MLLFCRVSAQLIFIRIYEFSQLVSCIIPAALVPRYNSKQLLLYSIVSASPLKGKLSPKMLLVMLVVLQNRFKLLYFRAKGPQIFLCIHSKTTIVIAYSQIIIKTVGIYYFQRSGGKGNTTRVADSSVKYHREQSTVCLPPERPVATAVVPHSDEKTAIILPGTALGGFVVFTARADLFLPLAPNWSKFSS
jgi:hypothetical protein